ncbi:MAG: AraC family transcriptional regulator [Marmoricola sp.]
MEPSLIGHDQDAAAPDQEATTAIGHALESLQIGGAIFLRARFSEPWGFSSLPATDLGRLLAPDAPRVIPFHVVAKGRCWIELDGQRHWAEAGDVVVLPYGEVHQMGGTEAAELVEVRRLVQAPPWDAMPFIEYGGGGAATEIVCGYVSCQDPLFDPELQALPPVVIVRPEGASARFVAASIEFALAQTSMHASTLEAPADLVRLLLVQILTLHLSSVPTPERGFIRALRDPVTAPALAAIHARPGSKWSVAELAATAHVSESLLDERFRAVLGMAPIRYLTAWRMHLAQDLLRSTDLGVAVVARRVGYESEEAFSRAFKRKHGTSPSIWRKG